MIAEELKFSILEHILSGNLNTSSEDDSKVDEIVKSIIDYRKKNKLKINNNIKLDDLYYDIPEKWVVLPIEFLCYTVGNRDNQINASEIKNDGKVAVVSQGKNLIDGYCNLESKKISDVPVIMFGDHTKNVKYIDFDFVIGADGTKLLKPIIINTKYFYYVISYISYKIPSRGYARHFTILKNKPIPVPPIEEQQRIVAKIEELLPLVEKYAVAKGKLDELNGTIKDRLKKSILIDALSGKLTSDSNNVSVDSLIEKIYKNKAELIKKQVIKIDKKKIANEITADDILFEIPANWKWERFSNLCYFEAGKTPERANADNWKNGVIPWVSISDIEHGKPIKKTKEKITEYALDKSYGGKVVKPNTLLMSFKLTIGKMSITTFDCVHNEAIININPYLYDEDLEIFKKYLLFILPYISKFGDSKNAVKGATLNATSISNLLIPVPPIEEQNIIITKLKKLFDSVDRLPL